MHWALLGNKGCQWIGMTVQLLLWCAQLEGNFSKTVHSKTWENCAQIYFLCSGLSCHLSKIKFSHIEKAAELAVLLCVFFENIYQS